MSNTILQPGQNALLQAIRQEDVRVRLSVTGSAPLRLIAVMLDDQGRAAEPVPLLTWRTQHPMIQINLNPGETISATLNTAAIQSPIQSILFLAAPYGRGLFQPKERLMTAIASDAVPPLVIESIVSDEPVRVLAICEFYLHPEQGVKVRGRSEWRHRELTTLLERLGVASHIIADQMLYPLPQLRHSDAHRAGLKGILTPPPEVAGAPSDTVLPPALPKMPAAETPDPSSPQTEKELEVIHLSQAGEQHRLVSAEGKFGLIRINFTWHQRLAIRASVKIDFGCFWELENGQKGQISRSAKQLGSLSAAPYAALEQHVRTQGALNEETLQIDGNEWQSIRRILVYAAIMDGPIQWDPLDGQVKVIMAGQPTVSADLVTGGKNGPIASLIQLENRSDQMRVSMCGGRHDSHIHMDQSFNFGLRWHDEQSNKRSPFNDTRELNWTPPGQTHWHTSLMNLFFGSGPYAEAEEMMRAMLTASALILIADGRVSMEERKLAVETIMQLPIGRYFAEFEVRDVLEKILLDLKLRRKASEALALRILSPMRGRPDVDLIVLGMRRIAAVDGQVSMKEERMVERLTRYLQASR